MTKIGIGTWDFDAKGTALKHVEQLGLPWYYNWKPAPLWNSGIATKSAFVPMVWGIKDTTAEALKTITNSPYPEVLGFNEPDNKSQANLTVEQALNLWPKLVATGKRLGSPAPTTTGLGWLGSFMSANPKVDFICVHHYSDSTDIGLLKYYLESVYARYRLPVWLTEWALVDWVNPSRFSLAETAAYAKAAIPMLATLPFLEKHAWFGAYSGGDGWHINTELFTISGELTAVGG